MIDRPKSLRYADSLATAERRIVEALPDIIEALIDRAKDGDLKAATYLVDRIMGRSAASALPPIEDRRAPYTDEDFEVEKQQHESDRELRKLLSGSFR